MYTSSSQYFSPKFKATAVAAIQAAREKLTDADFARASYSQANGDVKAYGRRWSSDEQVFQALVMAIENQQRDETGPGWLQHLDAMAWEIDLSDNPEKLSAAAKSALVSAIECDYYYLYEKQYN
jgi:hypothetical protein